MDVERLRVWPKTSATVRAVSRPLDAGIPSETSCLHGGREGEAAMEAEHGLPSPGAGWRTTSGEATMGQ